MLTIAIVARTPCSDGWTTIDVICIGSHLPTCHREMLRMPNAFDLRCPNCQHDDEVEVRAECWRLLCEDGTDDGPSMERYNWGIPAPPVAVRAIMRARLPTSRRFPELDTPYAAMIDRQLCTGVHCRLIVARAQTVIYIYTV